MIFRPATPGFIVTLTATILLALVSFNVPLIKSIYFLQATLEVQNVNGTITIGTLGYCLDLSTNGTTCSSAKVGYAFDPNALVGNTTDIEIPVVVVKWLTYALFAHVIAFVGAGVASVFGLLAHLREMSMTCCSTFVSGLAGSIAFIAFIFDIVLFFVVKKRVEAVGGSAAFGGAVWMTLAAAILLFVSGCVYCLGRCCISGRRPRGRDGVEDAVYAGKNINASGLGPNNMHAEQMRLDAVKAEADRKARTKNEVGLPAFPDRSEALLPLKGVDDEDDDGTPYRDHNALGVAGAPRRQGSASTMGQTYRGGYAQAPPGTRAVDEYYSPTSPSRSTATANTGYPPNRQYSQSSYHTAAASQHQQYPSSAYNPYSQQPSYEYDSGAAAAGVAAGAALGAYGSSTTPPPRQPSQPYADPYSHTAYSTSPTPAPVPQHQQTTSYTGYDAAYGTHDPFASPHTPTQTQTQPQNNYDYDYGYGGMAGGSAYQPPTATGTAAQPGHVPERSYTLGGGGYGANVVPDASTAYGMSGPAPGLSSSPPPMPSANVSGAGAGTGVLNAGMSQGHGNGSSGSSYEDAPPGYDATGASGAGPAVHVPAWGSKGGMHSYNL